MPKDETALGMIETRGLTAAIEAADAMLKAADVRIVAMEQTDAALMTAQVVGEVAAVQAAVEAGRRAAARVGEVVSVHVIPRADDAVRRMQGLAKEPPLASAGSAPPPAPTPPSSPETPLRESLPLQAPEAGLEAMSVRELRALARNTPGLSMQGRAIARANKASLMAVLSKHR